MRNIRRGEILGYFGRGLGGSLLPEVLGQVQPETALAGSRKSVEHADGGTSPLL
jgi:hypothetical protein